MAAPTDITLVGGTVREGAPAGTLIAILGAVDADPGDTFTFAITSDPSGFFEIVGNELRVKAGADNIFSTLYFAPVRSVFGQIVGSNFERGTVPRARPSRVG